MTSTSTKSFQFRVTGVTGNSFRSRTRQNVKKHIANIYYIESPPDAAIKLAYVGSQELQPATNLFIGDRSDSIYANSKTNTAQEFVGEVGSSSVSVASSNFLTTQEFIEAESGPIPLYYKHSLSTYTIVESIKVFDQNYNEVSSDKYKVVLEARYDEDTALVVTSGGEIVYDNYYIFNSLESSFDPATGDYTVYFVQYTTLVGSTETTYTELLNNEAAYTAAEFDDYWYVTGSLKPWSRTYALSDDLQLTLPAASNYAVRYEESSRIKVNLPSALGDEDPWFLKVVDGKFTNGFYGYESIYDVAEFENQAFNPIEPYKLAARSSCSKITDRLVKLTHENIRLGSMFSELSVLFELEGVIQYAITTDSSLHGSYVYDTDGNRIEQSDGTFLTWSTTLLLSLDRLSGIIHVDFDVEDSYDIYGTYTYEENTYTLTSLIMNPIFDPDAQTQTRVVYIVPKSIPNENSSTQTESVKWLKVSSSGVIVETNQNNNGYNEDLNFDVKLADTDGYYVEGILGMHYSWSKTTYAQAQSPATVVEILAGQEFYVISTDGFPRSGWLRAEDTGGKMRYFKYDSKEDTAFILSSTHVPTNGAININDDEPIELVNFVEERTTLSERDAETELDRWGPGELPLGGYDSFPSVFSRYFILAELSINPPHGVNELSIIDVREDGGGIKEDRYDEAKELNPEVQWFSDYNNYDGQVYPGKSVMVVKLPISILETYTLDNLKKIVEAAVPCGVYPLIRFYGYEPRVLGVTPGTASATIEWEKEGSEFVYDIWYSTQENGPFVRANTTRIIDGVGSTNTYTVTGLTGEMPYILKITMSDKYYMWWYGYNGHSSIQGGLGLDETTPVAPFGNYANFQFRVL